MNCMVRYQQRKGKFVFLLFSYGGVLVVYFTKLLYYSSDLPSLDLQVIAAIFFYI